MLTPKRLAIGAGILFGIAALAVGTSWLDDTTGWPNRVGRQIPVLKGGIDFLDTTGNTLTQIADTGDLPAPSAGSTLQESWVKHKDAFLNDHPVVKRATTLAESGVSTAADVGGFAFMALADSFFPDEAAKENQLKAKAQIQNLNEQLAQKQQDAKTLQAEISQLQDQIHDLEVEETPLKGLIPHNLGFSGFSDAPKQEAQTSFKHATQTATFSTSNTTSSCSCPPEAKP